MSQKGGKNNSNMKNEILRYLGYKNQEIDSHIDELIDDAMEEIGSLEKERYIYRSFEIDKDDGEHISLLGSNLQLYGEDIKDHLSKSKNCILMGASLGHQVDTRIRYYEKLSMTKAVILDACASARIEQLCDKVCKEIEDELLMEKKTITHRYSPGYGDLPIQIQGDFLSALNAKRTIGLTASASSILIPRKSVTAIVGIIDIGETRKEINCENCNKFNTCNYSKGGSGCGY